MSEDIMKRVRYDSEMSRADDVRRLTDQIMASLNHDERMNAARLWIRTVVDRMPVDAIEDLIEIRPGPNATTSYPYVSLQWARQWPCEEVWKARKL